MLHKTAPQVPPVVLHSSSAMAFLLCNQDSFADPFAPCENNSLNCLLRCQCRMKLRFVHAPCHTCAIIVIIFGVVMRGVPQQAEGGEPGARQC